MVVQGAILQGSLQRRSDRRHVWSCHLGWRRERRREIERDKAARAEIWQRWKEANELGAFKERMYCMLIRKETGLSVSHALQLRVERVHSGWDQDSPSPVRVVDRSYDRPGPIEPASEPTGNTWGPRRTCRPGQQGSWLHSTPALRHRHTRLLRA